MQLITLPNGWEVRESPTMSKPEEYFVFIGLQRPRSDYRLKMDDYNAHLASLQTYLGIGPKPDYPDGELPEGVVRLQHQYRYSKEGLWKNYDPDTAYMHSGSCQKRIGAIVVTKTPDVKKEETNRLENWQVTALQLGMRLDNGRRYLMGTAPENVNIEDALEAFGFTRDGLNDAE